jgi:hypothetical protein
MKETMIENVLMLTDIDSGISELVDKFLARGYDPDDIANALHYRGDQISPPISELNTLI